MPVWLDFFRRFLRDVRHIGAVLPSGRPLARAMAAAVGAVRADGTIVELGSGTGSITEELVRTFPENACVLIEREGAFIPALRERFPRALVVHGNAEDAASVLAAEGKKAAAVVSGLPMLSLPEATKKAVFSALERVLPPGGKYVQFTYGPSAWKHIVVPGFRLASSRRVWGNIPPATVLTFERV